MSDCRGGLRGWHRADAIRKSECGSRHLTIAQFLSSLHQKHRRRSRWVWNDELMLCEVPQCLLNIFSALAAEPTSGMYSPSFSALLTLSNSCQLSAMSRPPGHTSRAAGSGSSSVRRSGRRFSRAATSAWPGPVSLITYIMPSGATSLGIRSAASDWTRSARRGFG